MLSSNWRRVSVKILLICATVISCAAIAMSQAQSNAADLQGTVRDPNGAAVPGAIVTARNIATNSARTGISSDEGVYKILGLPPGNYEVTAEAQGFSKAKLPTITLTVGQSGEDEIDAVQRLWLEAFDCEIGIGRGEVRVNVGEPCAGLAVAEQARRPQHRMPSAEP